MLVERVQDKDQGVQKLALTTLTTEIKTSTSSMTSVPKPLKFLRPHYEKLVKYFETMPNGENKVTFPFFFKQYEVLTDSPFI